MRAQKHGGRSHGPRGALEHKQKSPALAKQGFFIVLFGVADGGKSKMHARH